MSFKTDFIYSRFTTKWFGQIFKLKKLALDLDKVSKKFVEHIKLNSSFEAKRIHLDL